MPAPDTDPVALEESLRHAAMFGDAATVERLLHDGVDVNAADNRGWTALLRAVERRHFPLARYLVERGADVTIADKRGRAPLLWVAQYGDRETTELLLANGAAVNTPDYHEKTPLKVAILYRSNDIVDLLLASPGWNPRSKVWYLSEALFLAAEKRNTHVIGRLIEAGADPNKEFHWSRSHRYEKKAAYTPLMVAAADDNWYLARPLLEHGADPKHKTYDRRSAITEALKELLSNPFAVYSGGHTKRLLLKYGVVVGLEEAVVAEDMALAQQILAEGSADVETPTTQCQTLLLWATQYGKPEMVRFLVEHGANVNRADNYHETPLMKAAAKGDLETVRFLIRRGADPRKTAGKGLWTAFDHAAAKGHLEVATWLFERYGFGPKRAADALVLAADRGHLDTLRFLLDKGADPNTETVYVYGTAIMRAALRGRIDLLQMLVEKGISVNQRTSHRYTALAYRHTALSYAASSGQKATLQWLLEHGADRESIEQAISYALQAQREDVANLLRKALEDSA